jgi:hypothetical protein
MPIVFQRVRTEEAGSSMGSEPKTSKEDGGTLSALMLEIHVMILYRCSCDVNMLLSLYYYLLIFIHSKISEV